MLTEHCPTCGYQAKMVDWSDNCECSHCGARFNARTVQQERLARAREDYRKRTGKQPRNDKPLKLA